MQQQSAATTRPASVLSDPSYASGLHKRLSSTPMRLGGKEEVRGYSELSCATHPTA